MAADTTEDHTGYLAPLPPKIETVALQYAWVTVAIDLTGTAFGIRLLRPVVPTRPDPRLAGGLLDPKRQT